MSTLLVQSVWLLWNRNGVQRGKNGHVSSNSLPLPTVLSRSSLTQPSSLEITHNNEVRACEIKLWHTLTFPQSFPQVPRLSVRKIKCRIGQQKELCMPLKEAYVKIYAIPSVWEIFQQACLTLQWSANRDEHWYGCLISANTSCWKEKENSANAVPKQV